MEADTTLGIGRSRFCIYAVFEVIRRIWSYTREVPRWRRH